MRMTDVWTDSNKRLVNYASLYLLRFSLFVWLFLLCMPTWIWAVDSTTIMINPKPESYYPGSLGSDAEGNFFLFGSVGGQSGLLKINSAGSLSLFSQMPASNLATMDAKGENFFYIDYPSLRRVDLETGEVTSVQLNPVPSGFLVATFHAGGDGNLYVGGKLSGTYGVLRISLDGKVNLLVTQSSLGGVLGNGIATDAKKENLVILDSGKLLKLSMADGIIVSNTTLPVFGFLLGEFVSGADDRIYTVSGSWPNYKIITIDPDGRITDFDTIDDNGHIATSLDGRMLYLLKTDSTSAAPKPTSSGALALAANEELVIKQYELAPATVDNKTQMPVSESKVAVQGGPKGTVNPDRGEVVRINFNPTADGTVSVKIYTLTGQLVWETSKSVSGSQSSVDWNCANLDGSVVSSDVYVIKIEGAGINETKKAVILR